METGKDEDDIIPTTKEDNKDKDEIIFHETNIKDIKDKKDSYQRSIITEEGIIFNEINDRKKCHCQSNKKI